MSKDDEVGGAELRGEVEQRDVLLEVSDDPRTASLPQPELKVRAAELQVVETLNWEKVETEADAIEESLMS